MGFCMWAEAFSVSVEVPALPVYSVYTRVCTVVCAPQCAPQCVQCVRSDC